MRKILLIGLLLFFGALTPIDRTNAQRKVRARRNVIIFIADGLRAGSVNAKDAPALSSIETQGVNFTNSHSVFPTFTMANASAIATGHALGDTGVFSNVIWVGYRTYSGTPVPFLENNQMLADVSRQVGGRFPSEVGLLAVASENGY